MATLVTVLFILFGAALTAYMALYAYGVYKSIPEKGCRMTWLVMFFVIILADVACFAGTVMMTVGFVMKGGD
jgi:hypothetical protein